jgi:membrane protein
MKERLRRLGERWRWLGRALEVQDRVGEVQGSMVASAITLSTFVSLFPLLLVVIAVIGFVAAGDSSVAGKIIDDLGVTGRGAATLRDAIDHATESRRAASIIGLLGLAWSASGVAAALQEGIRAPWQERSEGVKDRLKGVGWLALAGIGFAVAIFLGGVLNFLPDAIPKPITALAAIAVAVAIEVGLFLFLFWALGTRRVGWRDLVPGAVVAGVGFEVLKLVGTVYVPHLVATSSSLYGPLGVVFAVLAWLAILAKLLVYSSAVNAVRFEALRGTKTVPIEVPDVPDAEPVAATRGGLAVEEGDPAPATPDQDTWEG